MDVSHALRPDLVHRLAALGRPVRLIVTGGGTGGHTYPAVTTIRTVRALLAAAGIGLDVLYVGAAASLEERVAELEGIPFRAISTGKLRRAHNPLRMISVSNLRDAGRVPVGIAQARRVVAHYRPDAVLSTGGYVAVPIGFAAWLCRRPLLIHEQTVRLGLANRLLARAATRVAMSSESSLALLPRVARATAVATGNPIRPELLVGDPAAALKALDLRGWATGLPTVYVTGGAQGSVQINTLLRAVLPRLLAHANVLHQCGAASIDQFRQHAATLADPLRGRYHPTDFIGAELPDVLALADLVVSRSGAGTLAELTALGKPSILIPLIPSGGNEQEHNARHLERAGAAVALVGEAASPERIGGTLSALLTEPERRTAMAEAARRLGHPDAAQILATTVLELCATS
jgi:UDP-N-acetylglucosamine--N-acetylmuramyl-(pentapeptide) pyrophosphoryl-undecaprenol N-acetylglucosamine transferase